MRTFSRVFLPIALLAFAYFGSYFVMVRTGIADCQCGYWAASPDYRFDRVTDSSVAATFYQVAHELDRNILRPSLWSGTNDLVSLIAAGLATPINSTRIESGRSITPP
jgi:hypothetical protein